MSERTITISELEAKAIVNRLRLGMARGALSDPERVALDRLTYQLREYDRELSHAAPEQFAFTFGDE